jgi:hypothetical protein
MALTKSPFAVSKTLKTLGAGQKIAAFTIRRQRWRNKLVLAGRALSQSLALTILVNAKGAHLVLVSRAFSVGLAHAIGGLGRSSNLEPIEAGLPFLALRLEGAHYGLE